MNDNDPIFIYATSNTTSQDATDKQEVNMTETPTVNLENVEDLSGVCRTCAAITEYVIPIFQGEGLQNNLADKIHKHLPIQVEEGERLPTVLCYQCASTLLAWHELVECCVQSDAALRTCLATRPPPHIYPQEEHPGTSSEVDNTVENADKHTDEFAVAVSDDTKELTAVSTPQAGTGEEAKALQDTRHVNAPLDASYTCGYCSKDLGSERAYKEHLVATHADLLFHCDECDTYLARNKLILHMSWHAVQYADENKSEKPSDGLKNDKTSASKLNLSKTTTSCIRDDPNKIVSSNNDFNIIDTGQQTTAIPDLPRESVQDEAFSDDSDTDEGFGPLPESVFEAIEDTQDCPNESSVCDANQSVPITTEPTTKKKHGREKKRTCPICLKVYTASSSYFYHIKYVHREHSEYTCDLCDRNFVTRAALADHATIHTGELKFECQECSKSFRCKASLYIHRKNVHSDEKHFVCKVCQQPFRWKQKLLRHMQRHAPVKSHVCSKCGRAFSVQCDLLRHARTHTQTKAHACQVCGATFAQLRYLKVHEEKQHRPRAPATSPDTLPA